MTDAKLILCLCLAVAAFFLARFIVRAAMRRRRPVHILEHEFETMLSPAWHNEQGWPAFAIDVLPPLGRLTAARAIFIEHVSATYAGPGLPDHTITEDVPGGEDISIQSMQDGAGEMHPGPHCKIVLAVADTILTRAKQDLPPGYDPVPKLVFVKIKMDLYGLPG